MGCSRFFMAMEETSTPPEAGGGALRRPSVLRLWRKTLTPGQFTCPERIKSSGAPTGHARGDYSMAIITAALA